MEQVTYGGDQVEINPVMAFMVSQATRDGEPVELIGETSLKHLGVFHRDVEPEPGMDQLFATVFGGGVSR